MLALGGFTVVGGNILRGGGGVRIGVFYCRGQ